MKKALFALILMLCAGLLAADGIIIINPPIRPIGRPVPQYTPLSVKTHHVTVEIDDNIAVTTIDETFYNPNNAQLEGTFIFPLPEDAAIGKFSLFINGKETQGEVLDKDKAREIYEGIVRRMQDPALLEYVGRKMFKARVFPIPARGTRRVKLQYSQTLSADNGLYSYTYPLNTEKFSSAPLEDVVVDVKLKAGKPIKNVYCPTHKADIKRNSDTSVRLSYEQTNVLPDKDFSVFYSLEGGAFGLSLATFQKGGGDGYFIAMLSPSFKDTGKLLKKDVAFVFDTSGSMSGKKIKQAKNALKFCLNSLRKEDRFALVSFSTEARAFRQELAEANEANVGEALTFVEDLDARGGTNISDALETALKMRKNGDRPFIVVFMTDGKPTLGVQNENELIAAVKKVNSAGARIFVFGVGYDVNTFILDKIADDSRGARSYVSPEEDIEIKVSNLFTKVESPVLTDVTVAFESISTYDVYPKNLPDLFRGTQIEIMGRYKGKGDRAVILTGKINSDKKKYVFEESFNGDTAAGENIARLWATRKIYYLLDEIRLNGMKKELKDEVVRLSKEFGIMTPYTSFLVLEDEAHVAAAPRRSAGGAIRALRAERNAKAGAPGMDAPMVAKEAEAADAISGRKRDGRGAFQTSQSLAEKKKEGYYDADRESVFRSTRKDKVIKEVGGRTFYHDGSTWIDSNYDGRDRTAKITYMSDDYFKFVKANPKAGKYVALGKKVIFEYEGKWYEIEE